MQPGQDLAVLTSSDVRGQFSATSFGSENYSVTYNTTNVTLTVNPLEVSTASLPNGKIGSKYSTTLLAAGGDPPYTWTLESGALPEGLSLSSAGVISGTPLLSQAKTFTVKVTDSESPKQSATRTLSLTTT